MHRYIFITHLFTKFYTSSFLGTLVEVRKPETEENVFTIAILLFHIQQKKTASTTLSKFGCHVSFHDVRLSSANNTPVTEICASAMSLLLTIENQKVMLCYVFHSFYILTGFRENLLTNSKVEVGRRTDSIVISKAYVIF